MRPAHQRHRASPSTTLESVRAQKDYHVVVVFVGTPKADANADRLIEEGRAEAERLDKELRMLKIGWKSCV